MSDLYCVLLKHGTGYVVYGVMDLTAAEGFSKFLGDTVDPAIVLKLCSPTKEMLAWYQSELDRNNCTHGDSCPVHPNASGVHGLDLPLKRGGFNRAGG